MLIEHSFCSLFTLVANSMMASSESAIDATSENSQKNDRSYKKTSNYAWVRDILKAIPIADAELDESGDATSYNAFYFPQYTKCLTRTFVRIPLWSNVMMQKFGSENDYASSSQVENIFKDIKRNLCFKKKRVDIFMKKHINHLSGQMKLVLADQQMPIIRKAKRSASLDVTLSKHENAAYPRSTSTLVTTRKSSQSKIGGTKADQN